MFRLIVVTLAALFAILQIYGDPVRKPVQAREAPDQLSLASFVGLSDVAGSAQASMPEDVSDVEAVMLAMEAAKRIRAERSREFQTIAVTAGTEEPEAAPAPAPARELWYVTGSRVNLRQGPGTGNAVVTQVTLGTEAEVLGREGGWVRIQTTDGGVSGWIYGDFLNDRRPG